MDSTVSIWKKWKSNLVKALLVLNFILGTCTTQEDGEIGTDVELPDLHLSTLHCRKCPPGYHVARMCNETTDTLCEICPDGSFNLQFTLELSCWKCDECPGYSYERNPCSPIQNVNCASCDDTSGGYGNENFLIKCEKTKTTTTTTTTTTTPVPSITPLFTSGQYVGLAQGNSTDGTLDSTANDKGVAKIQPNQPTQGAKRKDSYTTEDVEKTTAEANGILFPEAGETKEEAGSTIVWPIILAAILGAAIFLIVGMLISRAILNHRAKRTRKHIPMIGDDPEIQTTMIMKTPEQTTPDTLDKDEVDGGDDGDIKMAPIEPIYAVPLKGPKAISRVPDAPQSKDHKTNDEPLPKNPSQVRAPKRFGSKLLPRFGLKKKKFYRSVELKYIDEDSDDDIVQNCGRPSSTGTKDGRRKRKLNSSSGGFLGIFRQKSSPENRGDDKSVSRSSSSNSHTNPKLEETAFNSETVNKSST